MYNYSKCSSQVTINKIKMMGKLEIFSNLHIKKLSISIIYTNCVNTFIGTYKKPKRSIMKYKSISFGIVLFSFLNFIYAADIK